MPPASVVNSDSDLESVISTRDAQKKRRRSSADPKYYCSVDGGCGARFKRLDHLDRHEFHHTGIKKHACTHEGCGKIYSIVTHLKRHLRTTHERAAVPTQKDVLCTVENCEKTFTSVCNMQRHIREVHENPKVYSCLHCGEKFTQKLKMRRHEIQKHTHEFPFSCIKCSKGFYQQWQCDRHTTNCKIYACNNCELVFEKWTLFMKHCKEAQHGRKYYKCEHCPCFYAKPGELQKHIAKKHFEGAENMEYKCTHEGCNRIYSYERNLKQHILTAHSGKRFECTEDGCLRGFSSAQNMLKHINREHVSKPKSDNSKLAKSDEPPKKKIKKARKQRKDAGKPIVSNLTQFTGLAVDKQFDKLLREREQKALNTVSQLLECVPDGIEDCRKSEEEEEEEEDTVQANNLNDKCKEIEIDLLISAVLE